MYQNYEVDITKCTKQELNNLGNDTGSLSPAHYKGNDNSQAQLTNEWKEKCLHKLKATHFYEFQ